MVHKVNAALAFLRDLKIYEVKKPYHLTLTKDRDSDSVITNIAHDVYEEIKSFIKAFLGAKDVLVMHYKVRDRTLSAEQDPEEAGNTRGRPIPGVHIDASADGALRRVQLQWPLEAEELQKRRFEILKIWRPLTSPLRHWPMAFCDVRSVDPGDMVLADQISPEFQGENTLLYFNPKYRFYYVSEQQQYEEWIFKQFDSLTNLAGDGCPHTSFQLDTPSTNGEKDQSVEMAMSRSPLLCCHSPRRRPSLPSLFSPSFSPSSPFIVAKERAIGAGTNNKIPRLLAEEAVSDVVSDQGHQTSAFKLPSRSETESSTPSTRPRSNTASNNIIKTKHNTTLFHSGGIAKEGHLKQVLREDRPYLAGYKPLCRKHMSGDCSDIYMHNRQAWCNRVVKQREKRKRTTRRWKLASTDDAAVVRIMKQRKELVGCSRILRMVLAYGVIGVVSTPSLSTEAQPSASATGAVNNYRGKYPFNGKVAANGRVYCMPCQATGKNHRGIKNAQRDIASHISTKHKENSAYNRLPPYATTQPAPQESPTYPRPNSCGIGQLQCPPQRQARPDPSGMRRRDGHKNVPMGDHHIQELWDEVPDTFPAEAFVKDPRLYDYKVFVERMAAVERLCWDTEFLEVWEFVPCWNGHLGPRPRITDKPEEEYLSDLKRALPSMSEVEWWASSGVPDLGHHQSKRALPSMSEVVWRDATGSPIGEVFFLAKD
ncbi:hypothetical protein PG994_008188 [Apiospora phragmitis]|uniref:Uncharacterized protein n=1 Tax=Apiospora phragmitis TaxID=2905665 RepID=A0ABR1UT15_9PEZI